MTALPAQIVQAKGAELSRKAILTKIHRIIDAYELSRRHSPDMEQIKQIVGRAK